MSVDRETLSKRIFGTGSHDFDSNGRRTAKTKNASVPSQSLIGSDSPSFDNLYASSSSPVAGTSANSSGSSAAVASHGATKEDNTINHNDDIKGQDVSSPLSPYKNSTSPQSVDHLPDEEEETEPRDINGAPHQRTGGHTEVDGAGGSGAVATSEDAPEIGSRKATNSKYKDELAIQGHSIRYKRFKDLLKSKTIDLEKLKKLAWNGVPSEFRPKVWQILLGYHPVRADRASTTIDRKRREYWQCVNQYMVNGQPQLDMDASQIRSVLMDIPRTAPGIPIMHTEKMQKSLERILYIWARRHPASGYVQGINDLASAFFVVFLTPVVNLDSKDLSKLPEEALNNIEADVFWCLNKMVDRIQDHYTPSQPGIQRMISSLRELCNRLDPELVEHIERNEEEFGFMELTFRWMNCLLMRELPMRLIFRLWDTYFSEDRGVEQFHVYVCAALLLHFSKQLKEMDFHDVISFVQKLPTQTDDWSVQQLEELLSYAYIYKSSFGSTSGHLVSMVE